MTAIRRAPALAASLVAVAALAACANVADPNPSEARQTREYRTGSNIPVKDSAPPMTDEERQKQQDEIRRIQSTGSSGKPKG